MKLRWVVYKNRVYASDITQYRDIKKEEYAEDGWMFDMSLSKIKQLLEDETEPVLQFFDESTETWEDVPEVVIYRNKND